MRIRNLLVVDGVPENCTMEEVEERIVECAEDKFFERIYFSEEDNSYRNFIRSENIVVGTQDVTATNEDDEEEVVTKKFIASKATAIWSDSQGRLLIINAFPSLLKQYRATPFPKE